MPDHEAQVRYGVVLILWDTLPPWNIRRNSSLTRFPLVLGSPQAIAVNIEIMRAFVRLREMLVSNPEFAPNLTPL